MRSKYSRRMTAKIFSQFSGASFDSRRFCQSRGLDRGEIDLFELGLRIGERGHVVAVQSLAEKLPPVDVGRELYDENAVHGLARSHPGQGGHLFFGRRDREMNQALGELPLERLQLTIEDFFRLGHEADLVAELLRLLEHVRREDDRLSLRAKIDQVFLHEGRIDRIQTRKDLV